jgi:hypothetical protein
MTDLLLNDEFELLIEMGDFVVGESKEQDIALILDSVPGAWKQSPLIGVGIRKHLSMPYNENPFLRGEILKHLDYDDIKVSKIELTENEVNIT